MKEAINDELYKEVGLEFGIPDKVVYDIINNGESKCTQAMITSNVFDGVRWPYLGAFKAKHKSLQILHYMKGLNSIQREFFLTSLKTGKFKRLTEADNDKETNRINEVLLQNGTVPRSESSGNQ